MRVRDFDGAVCDSEFQSDIGHLELPRQPRPRCSGRLDAKKIEDACGMKPTPKQRHWKLIVPVSASLAAKPQGEYADYEANMFSVLLLSLIWGAVWSYRRQYHEFGARSTD